MTLLARPLTSHIVPRMRNLLKCLAVLLLPAAAHSQAATPRPITIGTIDSIWSPTLKEYRKYEAYTPPGYRSTTYGQRAYPVLYLLDGDAHFHSVTGLLQILGTGVNGTYVVPEMIVIAIPNTDRTRDLTPTDPATGLDGKAMPAGGKRGGMPSFLRFMRSELIPFVDSAYRTEPYRVLVGHSLGGITAIDALYTMPEAFNAYVAIDPSLWWDSQVLLKQANAYFSRPAPAGRTLFVGQANTRSASDTALNVHYNSILAFNRILQSENRSGVRYGYKYYDDDDHGSVPLIAEYDALRFIFAGYKPNMTVALQRPAYVTEHFADVSTKLGYRVLPPERIVDQFAQVALATDTAKALAFMQMNATNFPRSAHAFASLGNLLLVKRDSAGAQAAFERSLMLAPGDQRMRDMLASLTGRK
jgi:predicted alpha/beta superfamily hydrolase